MLQRIGPIKGAWIVTTCGMMCAAGATPKPAISGVYGESVALSTAPPFNNKAPHVLRAITLALANPPAAYLVKR